jgi:hypothetical protein
MALPRRAQREVYTVFSESDFMAGAEGAEMFRPDTTSAEAGRRIGRLAGPALMAAVLAAIVVTLLAHGAHGPASGRSGGPPSPTQGSRAGQPRLQQVPPPAPAPVPVPERGSLAELSARRPTVGAAERIGTVAASSTVRSETPHEVAGGGLTPTETPEFGFER